MMIWGRTITTFPQIIRHAATRACGATITDVQILIIVVSALIMAGLLLLVHFTRLGAPCARPPRIRWWPA